MTESPAGPTTLANWQDPPFNRWGFLHVDQLLPTATVRRGESGEPLAVAERPILDLPVSRLAGSPESTVADVLADTETDAFLVLQDGVIVHESYASNVATDSRHLLMSVTKSYIGAVAGILAERGKLDLDGPIAALVPEVIGFGYDGATVRNLLDMRSGIVFDETYLNPDSEVRVLEHLAGWRPPFGESPVSTYEYLARLRADRPHGGGFQYRSCETDVLGWVCERASGTDMAALLSELIWQQLGTEHDAYIAVDLTGAAIHDGGLCATARDVARFGQLLLDDGRAGSGAQVLPSWWTWDVLTGAADAKDAFAHTSSFETGMPGGHYRHQLWVPFADGQVVLALGIHGQMVYVDQATRTVGVKLSAWPQPQSAIRFHDTLNTFRAIAAHLAATHASVRYQETP
jgi:CubicO group peptidase (beta-lactamase class C family)